MPLNDETIQQLLDRAASDPDFRAGLVADPVGTTGLDIRFLRAAEPNMPRVREVSAKVTKPIDGLVTAQLIDRASDVDGANDRASAPLKTVDTTPTTTIEPTSSPVPTAKCSAASSGPTTAPTVSMSSVSAIDGP